METFLKNSRMPQHISMVITLCITSFLFCTSQSATDNLVCPDGIGASAGDFPRLIYQGGQKKVLMVCGHEVGKISDQRKFVSEFQVIAPDQGYEVIFEASASKLYETSLETDGISLTQFVPLPLERVASLPLSEDASRQVPFKKLYIATTSGQGFSIIKTECRYNFRLSEDEIKRIISKAQQLMTKKTTFLLDDGLPYEMLASALSGSKLAANLLLNLHKEFSIDGSAAEAVEEAQEIYKTSLAIGCK